MPDALILNIALLFAALAVLRWLGLRLLYRFAPVWAVGPNGFLIDTTGRLGVWQMGDGHLNPRGDHAAADHHRTGCD
ncbi:MAG: hypothetical protein ACK4GO_10310 [Gemmobacter sp.]